MIIIKGTSSFKDWCNLPSIHDVNDYMKIHIQKPKGAINYFSYKSKLKFITCNYKQLLITKSDFGMFL